FLADTATREIYTLSLHDALPIWSRFGARLEPFSHVDLQLHTGRSLDVVTQADTLHAYGSTLVTDYPRYTAGTAMLETAEKIVSRSEEHMSELQSRENLVCRLLLE